jgi:hypothetical protein
MKQSKTKKRVSRKQQQLLALQVKEHIERYHPELRNATVDISPCGTYASVRKAQKKDTQHSTSFPAACPDSKSGQGGLC